MDAVFDKGWLFEGFSERRKQQNYALGEVIELAPDEILIEKDSGNRYLFLLLEGALKAVIPDPHQDGFLITIAKRTPGYMLGEYSFFDHRPPAVSIIAEQSSRVYRIRHDSLRLMLSNSTETWIPLRFIQATRCLSSIEPA